MMIQQKIAHCDERMYYPLIYIAIHMNQSRSSLCDHLQALNANLKHLFYWKNYTWESSTVLMEKRT